MYLWLWRKLPGKWWLKSLITLALIAGLLAVMYFWFFPWLDATWFQEPVGDLQ
jgi:hypothetical protein